MRAFIGSLLTGNGSNTTLLPFNPNLQLPLLGAHDADESSMSMQGQLSVCAKVTDRD